MYPERIYYEKGALIYPQCSKILNKYPDVPKFEIENHNKIPELRNMPDSEFLRMKRFLILGVRKTTRLVPNIRSSDFLVPFTSSGCSAMCSYCYLVCNYFKCSYLRVFVNREDMLGSIRKMAEKLNEPKLYELGSNSDMVLENTITGNLKWAIEQIADMKNVYCTFATKFTEIDDLLDAKHNGHTAMRISVNPQNIIKKAEMGTANLLKRIEALNKMAGAGYNFGINIAPIILQEGWQKDYLEMFDTLFENLSDKIKNSETLFFEIIFLTYGIANTMINAAWLPEHLSVFEKEKMMMKRRGKMCYKPSERTEAEMFLREEIRRRFPKAFIKYIV